MKDKRHCSQHHTFHKLYLNPFYRTEEDMENLRLDEDYMQNELDRQRLNTFLEKMGSKALDQRIAKLKRVYDI